MQTESISPSLQRSKRFATIALVGVAIVLAGAWIASRRES